MMECCGLCLYGVDVGVPEYKGVAYVHPECERHGEPEEVCYHGYPDKGTGCLICEEANVRM